MTHQELADIYERHRRALFALALSITRCPGRAEDAVHDAFARLCRASGRIGGDRVAYVFSAVRNAAVDQVRRGGIEQDVRRAQDVLFDLGGIDPRQQAQDVERDRLMAAAVEALPDDQREVVVLRIFAGLRFAQIAHITNAPLATVTTRYRRAMQRLRLKLESMA